MFGQSPIENFKRNDSHFSFARKSQKYVYVVAGLRAVQANLLLLHSKLKAAILSENAL